MAGSIEPPMCSEVWGAVMLTKCSNPSCYLQGGKLFLLGSDPALDTCKSNRLEYFWLCRDSCPTMTLRLGRDATVETDPFPEPLRSVLDDIALRLAERKRGLLLYHVSSPSIKRLPRSQRESAFERDLITEFKGRTHDCQPRTVARVLGERAP